MLLKQREIFAKAKVIGYKHKKHTTNARPYGVNVTRFVGVDVPDDPLINHAKLCVWNHSKNVWHHKIIKDPFATLRMTKGSTQKRGRWSVFNFVSTEKGDKEPSETTEKVVKNKSCQM